jgi:glycosyltransferase involved in cell wall biosynthesis
MPTESRAITYFPGTRGHNADFAMIAGAVQHFLANHPEWHLLVAGPLEFKLDVAPHRVRRLERVDFERYHEIVQRGAINLAPLEDSPFNRCKSALKIMEAGFFGIPSVASPIPDAERFAGDGVEFASSTEEWLGALARLADRFPYSDSWREQLRERVVRNASIEREAARWISWLGLASSATSAASTQP